MKIILSEEDFIKLVKGEVVEHETVEIILQDIGFYRMIEIISLELKGMT